MELESLLRGLGCVVLDSVPTIGQALRALARERADFAVLDVNLRGERVTPVAEALRKQGVPFVLVTGYGSERLQEEACKTLYACASRSTANGSPAPSLRR